MSPQENRRCKFDNAECDERNKSIKTTCKTYFNISCECRGQFDGRNHNLKKKGIMINVNVNVKI